MEVLHSADNHRAQAPRGVRTPPLRFAVAGTGMWANFQIPAWREIAGAELVALCNRTRSKAEAAAQRFGVAKVYDNLETLFKNERIDFVDIITEVPAHAEQVMLAAKYKIPVICQKPMGPDYDTCRKMESVCRNAQVPFFIHENYRWVSHFRAVKRLLDEGIIGMPRRAQITIASGTREMYELQPFSKSLPHSIITDMGCHLFDLIRFFFGQPQSIYCHALRRWDDCPCESIMTATLRYPTMLCSASLSERIQTQIFIDGDGGCLELRLDNSIRVSTPKRTFDIPVPVRTRYPWVSEEQDRMYGETCGQAIVACNRHLFNALVEGTEAETSAPEYLKTMRLVFAAVDSTERDEAIRIAS